MNIELINELRSMSNKIEDLSKITAKIIQDLKSNEFPIPIVKIMRDLKFVVGIQELDENLSGYIIIDDMIKDKFGTNKLISVNSSDSLGHQRFTIAHELAHYLFDYSHNNEAFYNTYNTNDVEDYKEIRANKFAANLLMPQEEFEKKYKFFKKNNDDYSKILRDLMDYFEVSKKAVELRIVELGLN